MSKKSCEDFFDKLAPPMHSIGGVAYLILAFVFSMNCETDSSP